MRRHIRSVLGSLFLSLLICWLPVSGDILHLRDGREIEGTITDRTETTVTIVTESEVREYAMSAVDFIERTEVSAADHSEVGNETTAPATMTVPSATVATQPTPGSEVCIGILKDLGQTKKADRTLSGLALTGLGLLFTFVAVEVGGNEYGLQLGLVTFGLTVVPGVFTLLLPTEVERAYAKVEEFAPEEREQECAINLEKIAQSAESKRNKKILTDVGAAALSALLGFYYGTLYYVIDAVWTYMTPSQEEKAFETYQAAIGAAE